MAAAFEVLPFVSRLELGKDLIDLRMYFLRELCIDGAAVDEEGCLGGCDISLHSKTRQMDLRCYESKYPYLEVIREFQERWVCRDPNFDYIIEG